MDGHVAIRRQVKLARVHGGVIEDDQTKAVGIRMKPI
jgi:hypothetical protein